MSVSPAALADLQRQNFLTNMPGTGGKKMDLPVAKPLTLADLKDYYVSHKTKHPTPSPVARIDGANFGLQGMISALAGPPKSGKTTVIGYMLASALMLNSDPAQTLNIQAAFAGNRDVVYLDLEQHISSTQDLHDKVLRYANVSTSPDNLHIMNLLERTQEERNEAIEVLFKSLNVHLLVIDGIADLLPGANDEEKSNALVEKLALLASKYNACVVVVIHLNKGGNTVRGHLGSQVERKCAGLIVVDKDRETKVHSIESRLIRIGDDFDKVCFSYSEEHRRMMLLDAVSTEEHIKRTTQKKMGKGKDPERMGGLMNLCFKEQKELSKKDLVAAIRKLDKDAGSDKTAERRIEGAIELGILNLDNGKYTLNG